MTNRIIKFRGQMEDGEWVYGYLYYEGEQAIISRQYGASWKVKHGTVGQFTGLTDRNGKEIYESDKVKSASFNGRVWEVIYKMGGFWATDGEGRSWPLSTYRDDLELIGNIYEG